MQNVEFERTPALEHWHAHELLHSFTWEDHACLEQALQACEKAPRHILTVGSAGESAFTLLLANPEVLTVVEPNLAQVALIELKKAAISILPHDQYMAFFGDEATVMFRLSTYAQLRSGLGRFARHYWDHHQEELADGIGQQGVQDSHFAQFRFTALTSLWTVEDFALMVNAKDLATQRRYWNQADPSQLTKVIGELFKAAAVGVRGGTAYLTNFSRLMEHELIRENPYLHYFFTGRPLAGRHPLWSAGTYDKIKKNLGAIRLFNQDLGSRMAQSRESFDFMNLSEVFEHIGEAPAASLKQMLGSRLNPGGLMAYWSLLESEAESSELRSEKELSAEISRHNRCWTHSNLRLLRRA